METPRAYPGQRGIFGGRPYRASCIVSDLDGEAGTDELVEFGRQIGMHANWVRAKGTMFESLQAVNESIQLAEKAGARMVSRAGLLDAIYRKRGTTNAAA
jgi:hypothetical protein